MQPSTNSAIPVSGVAMQSDPDLFLWRGDGIILIGALAVDGWSLSRGWLSGDAVTDVRRWRFSSPLGFQVQVRRLCRDATGRADVANHAFDVAGRWAAAQ